MRFNIRTAALAVLAAVLAGVAGNPVWAGCPLVDLETPALAIAAAAGQTNAARIAAFRREVIARAPQAYAPAVLGLADDAALDQAIGASLGQTAMGLDQRDAQRRVLAALPVSEGAFEQAFPDFRCDFPIYLMNALGRLDGAGRLVGGRPALVLGIDQIAAERDQLPLAVFLAHELFHRYHSQAAGFSDDPGEHQAIWRALWAEGLATYVSWRLTPGASVDQALMLPNDLRLRAEPKLRAIAVDLLAHLDAQDHDAFLTYFMAGSPGARARGLPWRSGYYAGFRVAEVLSRTRSLDALAHLQGPALHDEIRAALQAMAAGGDTGEARTPGKQPGSSSGR